MRDSALRPVRTYYRAPLLAPLICSFFRDGRMGLIARQEKGAGVFRRPSPEDLPETGPFPARALDVGAGFDPARGQTRPPHRAAEPRGSAGRDGRFRVDADGRLGLGAAT